MSTSPIPVSAGRTFQRLALATTALTYFLIAVGATVRVTGAGMGCPDWPMCFGLLVPPTSIEALPPLGTYDYPPGWKVESFDPLMTWIEYLNRLLGAVVGLAILATLVAAIRSFRRRPDVLVPTLVAFVGVLYAAWLGARVVAHELAPWIVTAHLLSAIGVVSALVIATVNAGSAATRAPSVVEWRASWFVWATGVVALVQGALGTQVRGFLEDVAKARPDLSRGEWLLHIGPIDVVHRTMAVVVLGVVIGCTLWLRRAVPTQHRAIRFADVAAGLVVVQAVAGFVLANFALPRAVQVLHLLAAALLLGALTAAAMTLRRPDEG